ncbi:MAG TPA: hypothetical protein VHK88_10675, partial [Aquihabitans sp.]|nr:hypothetical protein [Aquihabitans sp.]
MTITSPALVGEPDGPPDPVVATTAVVPQPRAARAAGAGAASIVPLAGRTAPHRARPQDRVA